MSEKFYNLKELAEITKVSTQTLRKRIEEGKLKANKFGREFIISDTNLNYFMKATEYAPKDQKAYK